MYGASKFDAGVRLRRIFKVPSVTREGDQIICVYIEIFILKVEFRCLEVEAVSQTKNREICIFSDSPTILISKRVENTSLTVCRAWMCKQ